MKSCKNCLYYTGVKENIVECLVKSKEELKKERMIYPLFYAGHCKMYKAIKYRFYSDNNYKMAR